MSALTPQDLVAGYTALEEAMNDADPVVGDAAAVAIQRLDQDNWPPAFVTATTKLATGTQAEKLAAITLVRVVLEDLQP